MDKHNIQEYIKKKTFSFFEIQSELESYAQQYHIPIISRDSLDLLIGIIKIKKPQKILEFGTAIGYSTIAMATQADPSSKIISFERDVIRYREAQKNIDKMGMQDRIVVYNQDVLTDHEILQDQIFDLVFIDAAKGQYRAFFDLIFDKVSPGGVIISDNIFHKGMIVEETASSVDKRYRTIYKRMNEYIDHLKSENDDFFTTLVPIGDGIAITYKYRKEVE